METTTVRRFEQFIRQQDETEDEVGEIVRYVRDRSLSEKLAEEFERDAEELQWHPSAMVQAQARLWLGFCAKELEQLQSRWGEIAEEVGRRGAGEIVNHLKRVKPVRVDGETVFLSFPSRPLWDTWKRERQSATLDAAIEAVVGVRYLVELGDRPDDRSFRAVFRF